MFIGIKRVGECVYLSVWVCLDKFSAQSFWVNFLSFVVVQWWLMGWERDQYPSPSCLQLKPVLLQFESSLIKAKFSLSVQVVHYRKSYRKRDFFKMLLVFMFVFNTSSNNSFWHIHELCDTTGSTCGKQLGFISDRLRKPLILSRCRTSQRLMVISGFSCITAGTVKLLEEPLRKLPLF